MYTVYIMTNNVKISVFKSVTALVFGVVGLLLLPTVSFAHIGYEIDLEGWAWSSTVGWVSMSCENTDSCDAVSYGVVVNENGGLDGFAWSEHIGWIQFGNLSDFPAAGGNARFTENGNMRGWVRALAGAVEDDGWDGWISLSCENTGQCDTANYGPRATSFSQSGSLIGFAWGSDVVGWVDFSRVVAVPPADLIVAGTLLDFADFDLDNLVYSGMSVSARFENIGGRATPDGVPIEWEILVQRAGDDIFSESGVYESALGSGESTEVLPFNFSDQGIEFGEGYEVTVTVNPRFEDAIAESNYDNNAVTLTRNVLPPDPGLSLSLVTSVIRQNTPAQLEWSIDMVYDMDCVIRGPGINAQAGAGESPNRLAFNPAVDTPDPIISTTPRPSAAVYDFTCTVDNPDGDVWEVGSVGPERLEVVSSPQEI